MSTASRGELDGLPGGLPAAYLRCLPTAGCYSYSAALSLTLRLTETETDFLVTIGWADFLVKVVNCLYVIYNDS